LPFILVLIEGWSQIQIIDIIVRRNESGFAKEKVANIETWKDGDRSM